MEISIQPLTTNNLQTFWELAFSDPNPAWKKWDAPYFNDHFPSLEEFLTPEGSAFYNQNPFFQVIMIDNQMQGCVSAYYEDGNLKRWLEIGIVIYSEKFWRQGIGFESLKIWLNYLWQKVSLPHIGLTTWSGNQGMIHLAQKLGMKEEARVRQVRYYQNRYWDSIKYGILRSEWLDGQK
ncbi:MAG: GNAT family N-acetyltransferase [Bombilactobacillus sp.]